MAPVAYCDARVSVHCSALTRERATTGKHAESGTLGCSVLMGHLHPTSPSRRRGLCCVGGGKTVRAEPCVTLRRPPSPHTTDWTHTQAHRDCSTMHKTPLPKKLFTGDNCWRKCNQFSPVERQCVNRTPGPVHAQGQLDNTDTPGF